MASRVVSYQVRYRLSGSDNAWETATFAAAATITLSGRMVRGQMYEVQIRAVDARGQVSAWHTETVTVGNTNRTGAAALPNIANQQSMWDVDTSVTFSASTTTEGLSTATISVSAGTLIIGSQRISYGASSATIDGAAESTARVYLYYDDQDLLGGTLPLNLTTDIVASASEDGRVAISYIDLTFPAAGGSSTGGGGIGGGGGSGGAGSCVTIDTWLPCGRQAGDIEVGDQLYLCDPDTGEPGIGVVEFVATRSVQCVEFETAAGIVLRCSRTAPIPVRDGYALAPDLIGRNVPTLRDGVQAWQRVIRVTDIGLQPVRHITVGDRCFWAGNQRGAYILHHNAKQASTEIA